MLTQQPGSICRLCRLHATSAKHRHTCSSLSSLYTLYPITYNITQNQPIQSYAGKAYVVVRLCVLQAAQVLFDMGFVQLPPTVPESSHAQHTLHSHWPCPSHLGVIRTSCFTYKTPIIPLLVAHPCDTAPFLCLTPTNQSAVSNHHSCTISQTAGPCLTLAPTICFSVPSKMVIACTTAIHASHTSRCHHADSHTIVILTHPLTGSCERHLICNQPTVKALSSEPAKPHILCLIPLHVEVGCLL